MQHKNLSLVILCTFVSIFFCTQIFAGPWPQKKRGIYLRFSTSYLLTSNEFDYKGRSIRDFGYTFEKNPFGVRDPSFRDVDVTAYLEYGLTDRLTLVANLPFKSLTSRREDVYGAGEAIGVTSFESITTGFSDLRTAFRYQLFDRGFVASLEWGIKFPLGYKKPPETGEVIEFSENEEEDNRAPLGTGRVDGELSLLVGKSLYPVPIYLAGGIGYRHRAGKSFHDELIYNLEAGLTAGRFFLKVYFDGIRNTSRPIPDKNILQPGRELTGGEWVDLNVGDIDISKISPSVFFKLNRNFDLQAELIHILSGKNTIDGNIFSLGVIFKK